MRYAEIEETAQSTQIIRTAERGSAIVISLFVLALMTAFVALALSRSSAEAFAVGTETAEARTFYAAQGSLESMTRNFNKKFEVNLKPGTADFNDVRNTMPLGLSNYTFNQEVQLIENLGVRTLTGGDFAGLVAKRDTWRLRTTATNNVGVQVQLTRNILNNLVPIFQFGIFYDDDLEFHPGPRFDFGGRVHSNGSLFLQANDGLYFSSKVSAADHIFTDISKNGSDWTAWDDEVYVRNASGTYVQVQSEMGSVLNTPVNGAVLTTSPLPVAYRNSTWPSGGLADGNLKSDVPLLQLPLKLNSDRTSQNLDLIEVIKRGREVGDVWNNGAGTASAPSIVPVTTATDDDGITAAERYYNKTGIRISLADSKAKLPGCATATGACGIRLDGDAAGQGAEPASSSDPRGYWPRTPATGSRSTRVNGDRFYSGNGSTVSTRTKQTWIKIETVRYNPSTEAYDKEDITEDILALGVTEVPSSSTDSSFRLDSAYYTNLVDSRSIVKLQRWTIPGEELVASSTYMSNVNSNYNYVLRGTVASGNSCSNTAHTLTTTGADAGTLASSTSYFPNGFTGDNRASMYNARINNSSTISCVVPFPINIFDTREGLYNDTETDFSPTTTYGANVPWAGVMSVIDIDVRNLRDFLNGSFDTFTPTGTPYHTATGHVLRGNDIPQPTNTSPKSGGWVLYVSDRRGDYDFDGQYDMEDVYGNNDGTLQLGEDSNKNSSLQAEYTYEAPRYTGSNSNISVDIAGVFDHMYYRRGVRLINGQDLPGEFNTTTPANTKGFTVSSENGIYVKGNYNATGVASYGSPTPYTDYLPAPTNARDVPASIAGDSVTILSNAWEDWRSFKHPFNKAERDATETTMRFAMLSGDTITTPSASPNQGGGDLKMNGGVHNFKRFLEDWATEFNYSGSIINLFNSQNNNGPFKCCNKVYDPPERNWVFDATFLDINRLPPGTPYFQYMQTTGFQRTND